MRRKSEMLAELKQMLNEALRAQSAGASHTKLAKAQGAVDGYMRALLDSGVATKQELLELVAAERARVNGPATREMLLETAAEIAAA
ncbi:MULTISPECIES: hypothetical protein [Polyangium]|uniref:Uncharacterized protein n=2 Tax=Polyangium TaxID=55 RepID=A0A4V5PPS5_9BACT|nr:MULTISPECIES: hypothetical protein [Polyangium]MDI1436639.1 hypothetical protein [Polyangium sorediatum]TKD08606.1 hypothetical protein E8A74_15095 [Polyangium fumosum]